MYYRLLSIAICTFWAVMTFYLVKDRIIPSWHESQVQSLRPASLTEDWEDLYQLDQVIYNGKSLGYSAMEIKKNEDDSYDVNHALNFKLNLLMTKQEVNFRSRLLLNQSYELDQFRCDINVAKRLWSVSGFTTPKKIFFKLSEENVENFGTLDLQGPVSLMSSVGNTLFKKDNMKEGDVYRIPVFDPLWRMDQGEMLLHIREKEEIKIGETELNAWRIESTFHTNHGEFLSTFWVDEEGEVVRKELMKGLVLEKVFLSPEEKKAKMAEILQDFELPVMRYDEYAKGALRDKSNQSIGIVDLLKGASKK